MADTNTYPARIGDVKAGFAAVKADVEQRMAQALAAVDSLADLLADVPPALASFGIQPYLPGLPNADQSAKVQAAMDAGVSNFANITVYINGALVWREGTVFRQRGSGEIFPKTQGFGDKQGAFIFGDSATRVFEQSLVLDDPLFVHVDAATPPQNTGNPTADTEAAKNRIAAWADNGLCARFLQDTVVTNGLFVGFYQGYKVHQERVRLINCRSDCLFDLEVSDASDCGYANNFHAYSFWIAHSPGIGADALRPYERGIWLRDDPDGNADKNDGFQINGGLVYGRKIGFDSENSYATRVVGLFVDGPPTLAAERETVGFRTGGDSNAVKISDCHAESVAIAFDLAHTGGHVRWMGNTASNIQTQPVLAGTGHSTGTIDLSNTGTNSVVKGLDSVGQHDIDVTLVGGTVTRLVDTDAVTTDKSRLRVRLAKSIGAATIDNNPNPALGWNVVRASDFGAVSGQDITSALSEALASLNALGGGTLLIEGMSATVSSVVVPSNISIEISADTVLTHTSTTSYMFSASGSVGAVRLLTAQAASGDQSITVADASGIVAGDWLILRDTADFSVNSAAVNYKSGESVTVKSVAGSVLSFDRPLLGSFLKSGLYTLANNSGVLRVTPAKNVHITGSGTLIGNPANNVGLIQMSHVDGFTVDGRLNIRNFGGCGIYARSSVRGRIENPIISDGINSVGTGLPGYGIALGEACHDVIVRGLSATRTRHAFTTLGGAQGGCSAIIVVDAIVSDNDFTALDTHEGVHSIKFSNCVTIGGNVANSTSGINLRAAGSEVENCTILDAPGSGIGSAPGSYIKSMSLRGNRISRTKERGIIVTSNYGAGQIDILDNLVEDSGWDGITLAGLDYSAVITDNKVRGWSSKLTARSAMRISSDSGSSVVVERNEVAARSGQEARGIQLTAYTGTARVKNNEAAGIFTGKMFDIPPSAEGGGNTHRDRPNYVEAFISAGGVFFVPGSYSLNMVCSIFSASAGAGWPNGIFRARPNVAPQCAGITTFAANVVFTTGVLTGTTGTAGNFTISAATTGLYFENRTANDVTISLILPPVARE